MQNIKNIRKRIEPVHNIYIYIKQVIFFVVMVLCCCGMSKEVWATERNFTQGSQGYSSVSVTTSGNDAIVTYYNFYTPFYWFACSDNGGADYSKIKVQCPGYKIYGKLTGASKIYGGSVAESKAAEIITISVNGGAPLADGTETRSDGIYHSVQPVLGTLEIHVIGGASASSLPISVPYGLWSRTSGNVWYYTYPATIDKSMTVQMHTHSYTKQVVDKQATCTSAGSGHYECPTDGARNGATYTIPALGHSFSSWSAWANSSNTEQKRTRTCSRCGKVETETRTRTYWNNINVNHPTKGENRDDGNCGWGYIKISNDGTNWSDEVTNENDMTANRTYGSRIYVKYIRPFYDYLEFGSITADGDIVSAGTNTWYHTVTGDSQSINIYMQYKHTTLTLDPNGGTINGNSSPQALSPQMQYSTGNWNNVTGNKPIRNGYTFEGWYDAATGGTKVYNADGTCVKGTKYFDSNGNSLCVNDLTVYAHWKINTYNIYYTLYGSNVSLQRTYTVESNNFTLPTAPTLQGYTFKGWIGGIDQKDPVKKGNIYQTLTKNITVEKGSYGDYFFRAIFEKTHSVSDGINTDDVYIAQSVPHEKQY